jgi:N-acetylneuraminic acid mutarotase
MDPATAAVGSGAVLMGGLDQADVSVADVVQAGAGGARKLGTLPTALHDAAAATLGGQAVLIGGGEPSHNEIWTVSANGNATLAGHLPAAGSDVSAATIGTTVYVVGGYTGTQPLDTIVAWTGTGTGRVVAHIPHPVRYAAVTAAAGKLIIAGGTSGATATTDVYSFDPASGQVSRIGAMPHAITHAAAAYLNGTVFVIGGRGSNQGTQTANIRAINPSTGAVTLAGKLPIRVSDTGAAAVGNEVLVVGGRELSGHVSDGVYVLRSP